MSKSVLDELIKEAQESKVGSDELLEVNWVESSDEYVVNRGSYIIRDGMAEEEAYELLDLLQFACGE